MPALPFNIDELLTTKNLRLVPNAPDLMLAIVQGEDHIAQSFGLSLAPGFKEFFASGSHEISPAWIESLKAATQPDPWRDGFSVVLASLNQVIGCCGFKGDPRLNGEVEISYGIMPACQGHGYATEAAQALVNYAFQVGHARLVLAHTRPDGKASQRVLQKCGFRLIGEVIDPDDGLLLKWEKTKN